MAGSTTDPSEEATAVVASERSSRTARARFGEAPESDGRYVVLEAIGAGGMGTVWRAYDPKLRREVALKKLRRDALDTESRLRAVREAQAMAQLSDPHVVAVHDVEFSDARADVLIVMEYVAGPTLRTWLAAGQRSVREIVDVFAQAGRGLLAAHRADLVHRDFKPSNVLVLETAEGRPHAKVTDFGLAKASTAVTLQSQDGVTTGGTTPSSVGGTPVDDLASPLTQANAVMGTPRYMSPEQHAGATAGPAADQYAFCVALWEALAGEPPFSGHALHDAKFRGPPPWPRDRTVPRHVLAGLQRGLSVQPDARFRSMAELLHALQHDPSARRRRRLATAAATVTALGTMGLAASWVSRRAEVCSGGADLIAARWSDPQRTALREAFVATEAGFAARAADDAIRDLDTYAARWADQHQQTCEATTVRREQSETVMDLRMACLQRGLQEFEATARILSESRFETVEKAASIVSALPPLDRCSDLDSLGRRVATPPSEERAAAVAEQDSRLAESAARNRAGQYGEALAIAEAVLEQADGIGYEPLVGDAHARVASALDALGKYGEAETHFDQALAIALRHGQHEQAVDLGSDLLHIVGYQKAREAEGRWLGRFCLGLAQDLDPGGGLEAMMLGDIGAAMYTAGKYTEARDHIAQALEIELAVYGEDDLATARSFNNLGAVQKALGEYDEAEYNLSKALEVRERVLGTEHPRIGTTLTALSDLARQRGDLDHARLMAERALEVTKKAVGTEHPYIADALNNIGIVEYARGDLDASLRYLREAATIREAVFGPDHADVADAHNNIGAILSQAERYEEASKHHERALKIRQALFADDHPAIAMSLTNIGVVARHLGDLDRAEECARRSLEINTKRLGPDHLEVASAHDNLGIVLNERHQYAEALERHLQARAIRVAATGEDSVDVGSAEINIAEALRGLGRLSEASDHIHRAIEIFERERGPNHPRLATAYKVLSDIVAEQGRPKEAREALAHAKRIQAANALDDATAADGP